MVACLQNHIVIISTCPFVGLSPPPKVNSMNLQTILQGANTGLLIFALTVITQRLSTPASLLEPASYVLIGVIVQLALSRLGQRRAR